MTAFNIDMSQLESDRAELQRSVETLAQETGRLHPLELRTDARLPAEDRVGAAWDSFIDGVSAWVAQFDAAVQHLSRLERTASQTDSDTAAALARLA